MACSKYSIKSFTNNMYEIHGKNFITVENCEIFVVDSHRHEARRIYNIPVVVSHSLLGRVTDRPQERAIPLGP